LTCRNFPYCKKLAVVLPPFPPLFSLLSGFGIDQQSKAFTTDDKIKAKHVARDSTSLEGSHLKSSRTLPQELSCQYSVTMMRSSPYYHSDSSDFDSLKKRLNDAEREIMRLSSNDIIKQLKTAEQEKEILLEFIQGDMQKSSELGLELEKLEKDLAVSQNNLRMVEQKAQDATEDSRAREGSYRLESQTSIAGAIVAPKDSAGPDTK
jgi:hypothetical protein